jgi:hypothetical protein
MHLIDQIHVQIIHILPSSQLVPTVGSTTATLILATGSGARNEMFTKDESGLLSGIQCCIIVYTANCMLPGAKLAQ